MDEIDCKRVLADLYSLIDGELTDESRAAIEAHIESCNDCLRRVGMERQFKQWLHETCVGEEAPPELLATIRKAIASTPQ